MRSPPPPSRTSTPTASRRTFLGSIGTALGIGLTGCLAGAENSNHDSSQTPASTTIPDSTSTLDGPLPEATVIMQSDDGHRFTPPLVWIERGGKVTWKLGSGTHDTAAYHPANSDRPLRIPETAAPWDSDMLMQDGDTFDLTLTTEGVYDYFCSPHEFRGMVGRIIVGSPNPQDQPALTPPQNDLPQEARTALANLNDTARGVLGEHS